MKMSEENNVVDALEGEIKHLDRTRVEAQCRFFEAEDWAKCSRDAQETDRKSVVGKESRTGGEA